MSHGKQILNMLFTKQTCTFYRGIRTTTNLVVKILTKLAKPVKYVNVVNTKTVNICLLSINQCTRWFILTKQVGCFPF